jgi:UDP-N-acetylmuramyl pentapeptide phosphotransferase/UDP-N-acetylglucosamine-1-phosphate transferase
MFQAMLVVIKVMMNESIIFFALLSFIILGFLQAFIGLDKTDDSIDSTAFVMQAMINAIMTSPDFEGFEDFSHPFGIVLYYIYTFVQ